MDQIIFPCPDFFFPKSNPTKGWVAELVGHNRTCNPEVTGADPKRAKNDFVLYNCL